MVLVGLDSLDESEEAGLLDWHGVVAPMVGGDGAARAGEDGAGMA